MDVKQVKRLPVFLAISSLPAYGGNASIELLAPELRKYGFEPSVFVQHPVENDNQYYRSLLETGVPVFQWPFWQPPLWLRRRIGLLVILALPLRVVGVLAYRLLLGRPVTRSWQRFPARLEYLLFTQIPQAVQPARFWIGLTCQRLLKQPVLVHVFRADTAAAIRWANWMQLPVVYTEAQEPPRGPNDYNAKFYKELERFITQAAAVIAPSQAVQKALRSYYKDGHGISVIPWMVAVPSSQARSSRSPTLSPVIGYTGRLSPEKGLMDLLLAARQVMKLCPQARFFIWGLGPQEGELRTQARALGLDQAVIFKGVYDSAKELSQVMSSMDVVVLPSLTEGLPFSVIEAMAYARPVVVTAVGGSPDVVVDGVTGLVVPPRNPDALAEAICRLLESEETRQRMGQAGRRRYEECYTPAAVVPQIVAVYQRVLGGGT